ncbi:hypothetical protein AAFF_G00093480 [Aldrovandia affinis]|uniref:Uncharacterized protein n=1 Tax=Aldrovandia affinis TaxID=143900 RepID=A0AAD7WXZ5_9TELE|nr:hypothetical protein AAFF_G00093480 [Aldrovandia affinis]
MAVEPLGEGGLPSRRCFHSSHSAGPRTCCIGGRGTVALPSGAERPELMKDSVPGSYSAVIDYAADVQSSAATDWREGDRNREGAGGSCVSGTGLNDETSNLCFASRGFCAARSPPARAAGAIKIAAIVRTTSRSGAAEKVERDFIADANGGLRGIVCALSLSSPYHCGRGCRQPEGLVCASGTGER